MAGYGEREVVDKLNAKFKRDSIVANAYRNPQCRRVTQVCDICIDSTDIDWFKAIEVKSLKKGEYLNFQKYFTVTKNGEHQLDRLCDFAVSGGREPLIVLFVREDSRKREIYTFDALDINVLRMDCKPSIKPKEFKKYDTGWYQGAVM